MSDVTVTLSQEECNFVAYVLRLNIESLDNQYTKLHDVIDKNGSLTGIYGETMKELDVRSLTLVSDVANAYEAILEKFLNALDAEQTI